jgi:hypothetical protein
MPVRAGLHLQALCWSPVFLGRGEIVENSGALSGKQELRTDVAEVHASVGVIEADTVNMNQAGANEIRASQVDMHLSGAGSIEGGVVHLDQAGAIVVRGESAMLVESTAGIVISQEAQLDGARAVLVAGNTVHAEGASMGVLLAREVHGEVHTILDTRGALLAGISGGLVLGVVLLLGGLLMGRPRR